MEDEEKSVGLRIPETIKHDSISPVLGCVNFGSLSCCFEIWLFPKHGYSGSEIGKLHARGLWKFTECVMERSIYDKDPIIPSFSETPVSFSTLGVEALEEFGGKGFGGTGPTIAGQRAH